MENFHNSIRSIQLQAEGNMPAINKEIDTIIETKKQNVEQIEVILDILLNYEFMGVGSAAFNRLNNYYRTFNEEAYNDWVSIREMMSE
jgi:hypothetical protein